MAATPDVVFPTWLAMEKGVSINGLNDHLSVPITGVPNPIATTTSGRTFSIVLVCTVDVIQAQNLISIKYPTWAGGSGKYAVIVNMTGGGGLLNTTVSDGTLSTNPIQTTLLQETISAGQPIHLVYVERGPSAPGGALSTLYLNGKQLGSSTSNLVWGEPDVPTHLTVEKFVTVGALSMYDYELSDAQVLEDYERASAQGVDSISDITSVVLRNFHQPELNTVFDETNGMSMTTDTTGTFKILNANLSSSFLTDQVTGLPKAGIGTWGSSCTFAAENHAIRYKIIATSAVSIVGVANREGWATVSYTLDANPTFSVSTRVTVQGLKHATSQEYDWVYNGSRTITGTSAANVIEVEQPHTTTGTPPALTGEVAQSYLNYPAVFDGGTTIVPPQNLEHTYYDVAEGEQYVVRVRGNSRGGKTSEWLTESIRIGADLAPPQQIYFEAAPGTKEIRIKLDFSRDTTGAVVGGFHTETNLSEIELVVATENTNRYAPDTSTDPGVETPPDRLVATVRIPERASASGIVNVVIPTTHFEDYYCWARLVTTSGIGSKWFPEDSGAAALRDRFANPPVLVGVGPVRPNNGEVDNMLPTATGTTTTIDTTTNSGEGPASGNANGLF